MEKKICTLVEITSQKIIAYIIEHRLVPGNRLPTEAEFLAHWDVSRGTLREAFKLLVARNILEIRQGAGTFISPKRGIPDDPLGLAFIYDDDRLALDLLDVRLMLEPRVAALAARYATEGQRADIAESVSHLEWQIAHGVPYADTDCGFHRLIAEASGNRVIKNLTHILSASVAKNIEIILDAQRESNTLHYHRKIMRAITQGDSHNAHDFMAMHLQLLREFVLDKIEQE